jgi:hypothetical protein
MMVSLFAVIAMTAPQLAPPAPPPLAAILAVQEDEASPADPIQEVIDEYDVAYKAFLKLYRAASKEEKESVSKEHYPNPYGYVERILVLAEASPGTESALTGYLWVLSNAQPDMTSKAITAIERDHMDSDQLGPLCSSLARDTDNGERLLLSILENSPHEAVRGSACFYLGRLFMTTASNGGSREESAEEVAAASATALEFFERVEDEYADVEDRRYGTLGAGAERNLFQLRNLQIGMVAPDIVAADLDGVEFKLSDYRGKVVVLDFWGDW